MCQEFKQSIKINKHLLAISKKTRTTKVRNITNYYELEKIICNNILKINTYSLLNQKELLKKEYSIFLNNLIELIDIVYDINDESQSYYMDSRLKKEIDIKFNNIKKISKKVILMVENNI